MPKTTYYLHLRSWEKRERGVGNEGEMKKRGLARNDKAGMSQTDAHSLSGLVSSLLLSCLGPTYLKVKKEVKAREVCHS